MSKTILAKAHTLSFTFPLLLAGSMMACVETNAPSDAAQNAAPANTEAALADGDGEFFGPSSVTAPAVIDNSAPCGDRTLAIVHARSGATYVFCGMGNGNTGVLEELPADGSAESLLDAYATPGEVLRAVAPEDANPPAELIAAVDLGGYALDTARPQAPVVLGLAKPPVTSALSYYCANPAEYGYAHGWNSSFIPFIEEFVQDYADCELHLWYTNVGGSWTSHQRTASSYQVADEYGSPLATACGGKEHILSCNGSTLFEALRKETPSSSWTTSLSYWVADGASATWKMYASDCQASSDRDDMRYTGNSEPGAYHYYSTIFIKWLDGAACVFD